MGPITCRSVWRSGFRFGSMTTFRPKKCGGVSAYRSHSNRNGRSMVGGFAGQRRLNRRLLERVARGVDRLLGHRPGQEPSNQLLEDYRLLGVRYAEHTEIRTGWCSRLASATPGPITGSTRNPRRAPTALPVHARFCLGAWVTRVPTPTGAIAFPLGADADRVFNRRTSLAASSGATGSRRPYPDGDTECSHTQCWRRMMEPPPPDCQSR